MKIKAILSDVDGVLTDGKLRYDSSGESIKVFSARDGHAFRKLKEHGYLLGILSGRDSGALRARLSSFEIDYVALGEDNKQIGYDSFKAQFNLKDDEIAYIGDDELDIPILKIVGMAYTPIDAHSSAKAYAHRVLPIKGGEGVIRVLFDELATTQEKPTTTRKEAYLKQIDPGPVLPKISNNAPIVAIIGMNVIENEGLLHEVATSLKGICERVGIPMIFKASFDKANRSSIDSFRGPGLEKGLRILETLKEQTQLPILTDIHEAHQAKPVSEVADIIQIPAFLCRQTELLRAAANSQRPIHIKKMQMMAPIELRHVIDKLEQMGASNILLCERGTLFGYHNLVVDPLSFPQLKAFGYPVTFDVTHALQKPGAGKSTTLGRREYALPLMLAGVSQGIAGIFIETHPDPEHAKCDGPCATPLDEMEEMLHTAKRLDDFIKGIRSA